MDKLRQWLQGLRNGLVIWAATKAVAWAFAYLEAKQLGLKLNRAMDASQLGKAKADLVQQSMAVWLESVARELRA